jgi:hypothetical protein
MQQPKTGGWHSKRLESTLMNVIWVEKQKVVAGGIVSHSSS